MYVIYSHTHIICYKHPLLFIIYKHTILLVRKLHSDGDKKVEKLRIETNIINSLLCELILGVDILPILLLNRLETRKIKLAACSKTWVFLANKTEFMY